MFERNGFSGLVLLVSSMDGWMTWSNLLDFWEIWETWAFFFTLLREELVGWLAGWLIDSV